jgi:hypothetical protein
VVSAAQRDRELIADLAAEGRVLCEPQMVSIRRLATANQTRLLGYVSDVLPVTNSAWLGEGEGAFVDCPRGPLRPQPLA